MTWNQRSLGTDERWPTFAHTFLGADLGPVLHGVQGEIYLGHRPFLLDGPGNMIYARVTVHVCNELKGVGSDDRGLGGGGDFE